MIVASAESSGSTFNGDPHQEGSDALANPHTLSGLSSLDDVRFHTLEVSSGKVMDRIKFSRDYILLSGYSGVCMNGRRLAIISLHNQLITIYKISEEGKFIEDGIIGHSLHLRNKEYIKQTYPGYENSPNALLGLKQRLFSFLYKRALLQINPVMSVRIVYTNWEILEHLCISRAQFLDENHLLIKLSSPESLSARSRAVADGMLQMTSFFIVYSLADTRIKSFHRSTSEELYEIIRDYNDFLRVVSSVDSTAEEGIGLSWQTTPSNDLHERQLWDRNLQLLAATKPTQGDLYAAKRLILSLPYTPQSFSESPYVDPGIFRFDERSVSASERQRSASDFPVRFYSRHSDRVRFRLNSGACPETAPPTSNPYRVK